MSFHCVIVVYRNINARYSCLILCLPALSSYDSHAGPMASNAEVSGQLDVRLTTANCYPEAVCPVVIVYIGTGGKVLPPDEYMGKFSPDGNTTTLSPVIKTR